MITLWAFLKIVKVSSAKQAKKPASTVAGCGGRAIQPATLTIMNDIPVAIMKNRIQRLKQARWEEPHADSKAVLVKLATNAITRAPQ